MDLVGLAAATGRGAVFNAIKKHQLKVPAKHSKPDRGWVWGQRGTHNGTAQLPNGQGLQAHYATTNGGPPWGLSKMQERRTRRLVNHTAGSGVEVALV
eukprot:gene32122-16641_t